MKRAFYSICSCVIFLNLGCALFGGASESLHRTDDYHVIAPKNWQVKDTENESDKTFVLPSGNIVTVTSSCKRNTNVPLEILTKHLLLGARNIKIEKREKYLVSGNQGLYSSVRAQLDGVQFRLELFVLPKDSCVFDFTLVSPKTITESEQSDFITFFKSFSYGTN